MGQSAGASSIMHHITSNGDRNAHFKSAIVQSPAFFPSPNQTTADQTFRKFMALTSAKDLDDLLKADTLVLMQANADITFDSSYGLFEFGPVPDGAYIRQLPAVELGNDHYRPGVGLMIGHTRFDGLLFTPPWIRTDAQLRAHIQTMYPGTPETLLDEVEKRYPIKSFATAKEKLLQVSSFLDVSSPRCAFPHLLTA